MASVQGVSPIVPLNSILTENNEVRDLHNSLRSIINELHGSDYFQTQPSYSFIMNKGTDFYDKIGRLLPSISITRQTETKIVELQTAILAAETNPTQTNVNRIQDAVLAFEENLEKLVSSSYSRF